MTREQIALMEAIKATFFRVQPHYPADVDWDAVLAEAKNHAVPALAAPSVPGEQTRKWQGYIDQNTAKVMQILHAQQELVRLFDGAGIPMVILKGAAAAVYYPEPLRRTMGDVDLLVPPERFDEAKALMDKGGYSFQDNDDGRHVAFEKYGFEFELHRSFSTFELDIEPAIAEGLSRIEYGTVLGTRFPMLPAAENGLVMLSHIRQHLIEERFALGLRQVVDWMAYVHANAPADGWEAAFTALARRYRLDRLAATMTYLCQTWLGLPDEVGWTADEAAAAELMEKILAAGNFSAKLDRNEMKRDGLQNTLETARQKGFFRYLQQSGEKNWSAARRYKLLRPLAWLYQLLRCAVIVLSGVFGKKDMPGKLAQEKKELEFRNRIGI